MNILLVEDNKTILKGLEYSFQKNGYNLIPLLTVEEATMFLNENTPNLIILDIALPDGSGLDLFKKVIKRTNIPTIFLTAKDDEDDIVEGLNLGAEDYVTKPFSTKELLARVNKILLRSKKESVIQINDIKYDIDKMIVYKNDKALMLTSLELKLVNLLFMNLNRVVSRGKILDYIWDWTGNYVDDHTVTVYFNRIREKLGTDIIITVKGIGYRIDEK